MSTLYTKNGCLPTILPYVLEYEDGTTSNYGTTFTAEEIARAGWSIAPEPPDASTFNTRTHRAQWDPETSDFILVSVPQEEIDRHTQRTWDAIRNERNSLLTDSDFIVVKSLERGETIPSDWSTYRQGLRDITTQSDPWNLTWPTKPE